MPHAAWVRSVLSFATICAIAGFPMQGCSRPADGMVQERVHTQAGYDEWERQDKALQSRVTAAKETYKKEESLEHLKDYESSVREYLDHGFGLYRAYQETRQPFPAGLASSLEQRTTLFMDVADEYIKQGSIAVGESIASEVVRSYSDLPVMSPAQRRAEAVLLRYRYRQDY